MNPKGRQKMSLIQVFGRENLCSVWLCAVLFTGPKGFLLDRLMAIFYSIVEDRVAPSASILSQISSLVSLNLLARINADDQIGSPKYKCLVSFEFIQGVAKQLEFDIVQYLYNCSWLVSGMHILLWLIRPSWYWSYALPRNCSQPCYSFIDLQTVLLGVHTWQIFGHKCEIPLYWSIPVSYKSASAFP